MEKTEETERDEKADLSIKKNKGRERENGLGEQKGKGTLTPYSKKTNTQSISFLGFTKRPKPDNANMTTQICPPKSDPPNPPPPRLS